MRESLTEHNGPRSVLEVATADVIKLRKEARLSHAIDCVTLPGGRDAMRHEHGVNGNARKHIANTGKLADVAHRSLQPLDPILPSTRPSRAAVSNYTNLPVCPAGP